MINTIILVVITLIALLFSVMKSREKTVQSIKTSRAMLFNTVREVIGVLAIVGLILAVIPPSLISDILGHSNNLRSTAAGALIGTVTIIPGVIAFPLSKELLEKGASLTALAAFITTLTMVGFATAPIEIKQFGKKFTLYRNSLSFIFALMIALLMGVLL